MPRPPLPELNCRYGAPMGRQSYWPGCAWGAASVALRDLNLKVYLHRLDFIDGCYDQGGAYWGSPANVYRAIDEEDTFCTYLRANNRGHAKAKLKAEFPTFNFTFFN